MNNNLENINIWESNLQDKFTFLHSFEELKSFIEKHNIIDLIIHDKQLPNQEHKSILDKNADNNGISITYTDDNHPIAAFLLNDFHKEIIIHPQFFEQHKDKIKALLKEKILEKIKSKSIAITIPDILIDDEFIDFLINDQQASEKHFNFTTLINSHFTDAQIQKLKNAHIEVAHNRKKISTRYLVGPNSMKDLQEAKYIYINDQTPNEEINNLIYLNESAKIFITYSSSDINEHQHLYELSRIFNILSKHQRNYNINIKITNRELLKLSGILNHPNLNLTIENDFHDYTKEEYLKEEEQLDKLVAHIKESNMSPYEKYLAVYNIVKQFKPYKENEDNKEESRNLRYILNNEYIVCVGFSKLLTTLLNKVGISSTSISVSVDTSYDEGFTQEAIPTQTEGHQRNIIKIDDDKYNIHGIFIADATWDNDLDLDLYNNHAMTFDRKKEAKRLETLTDYDLLLDFHNFEEFKEKINFFLRRKIKKSNYKDWNKKLFSAYNNLYDKIMEILQNLDMQKYNELYGKYHSKMKNQNNLEDIYCNFLTDYAQYILPIVNKHIDNKTVLTAAMNVIKATEAHSEEELKEISEKIKTSNEKASDIFFPYLYDPNETRPNYLDTEEKRKR